MRDHPCWTSGNGVSAELRPVPSLDAIAADPDLARDLPRHIQIDLALKAVKVHAVIATALAAAPAPPRAVEAHEELLTEAEVAAIFHCKPSTIRHKARTAPFRDFLLPGSRPMLFVRSRIDRYIRQHAGRFDDESSKGLRGVNSGRRARRKRLEDNDNVGRIIDDRG